MVGAQRMSSRVPQQIRTGNRMARCLAASLAVVTLAAQLLSIAHMATVTHVTCAEHGESVELSSAPTGDEHHHAGSCLRQDAADSAHHDHCFIASFRRERSTVTSHPATPGGSGTEALQSSLVVSTTVRAPIPIILLAPKNSPPV